MFPRFASVSLPVLFTWSSRKKAEEKDDSREESCLVVDETNSCGH